MADPDSELRRGLGFNLLAQLAFLPSVISSFFTRNKEGGAAPRAPPLDPPLKTRLYIFSNLLTKSMFLFISLLKFLVY